MKDKEKQIEEMAKCMANCENTCDECFERLESVMTMKIKDREQHCQAYMFAKRAVEQGYRKIDKDSVVLSREEWKQIKNSLYYSKEELDKKLAKSSKETAEKILKAVLEDVGEFYAGDIVEELAKQFGVDIGDEK